MHIRSTLLAATAGALLATAAHADTLAIDRAGVDQANRQAMPSRGMSMRQVESGYGAPVSRRAPVGNPPISRWEYPGYIVYFEYSHVIHAVEKRPTQPQ